MDPGAWFPSCWYLIAADGEQDVLLRDLKARGEHGFEVSLVAVLPKTGHLSGAGHLHPQHHISSSQAREGKLWDLRACDTRRTELSVQP